MPVAGHGLCFLVKDHEKPIIQSIIQKNIKKEEKCDERKRRAGELKLTY
jgi:hypothetical protein